MANYEVIVGNVGTVYSGVDEQEAVDTYGEYRNISQGDFGRASGEEVTLTADGDPIFQHVPALWKKTN
jgi:hypothetical protein